MLCLYVFSYQLDAMVKHDDDDDDDDDYDDDDDHDENGPTHVILNFGEKY